MRMRMRMNLKRRMSMSVFFFTVLLIAINYQAVAQDPIPVGVEGKVTPISELKDEQLQQLLLQQLHSNQKWKRLIKNKKLSIGIVDLSNPEDVRYAGVNDDYMMYAASLPKIAILLAAMDAIENGELADTKEIREDLRLMISKSNNRASTRMIDRLGYAKIEAVLRAPETKLYDETVGGGLWVGKRYAAGGKRHPDPLKGLSHAATTRQVCSFYYQLVMGNLVSEKRSKEMLEILKDPALHHKFVSVLDNLAPKAKIYRKSGSWKNYHSDSALVWGPQRQYIIVALVEDGLGEQVTRNLVRPLDKVLQASKAIH
ncbi:MAG: serine hydrolase [Dokdonia sp.]